MSEEAPTEEAAPPPAPEAEAVPAPAPEPAPAPVVELSAEAKAKIEDNFKEEQLAEYQETFSLFDINDSNTVPISELGNVLRAVGQSPTEADLQNMMKEMENNDRKTLDFHSFLSILIGKVKDEYDGEEKLVEAFKVLDKENNGYILASELRHVLTTLGETLTDEEAEELIKDGDLDGTGQIPYEEFAAQICSE